MSAFAAGGVPEGGGYAGGLRRGFLAVLPLWPGLLPLDVAFALFARDAGYGVLETQAISALVFTPSAQIAAVTLFAEGAGLLAVALTALALNLRHVLYGLSLGSILPEKTNPPRPVLAFFLTDESYGLTVGESVERPGAGQRAAFMLGAGLSLYASFNLFTFAGSLLGSALPDPASLGLDFVLPLTFLALLIPLLRSRRQVLVACASGALALLASRFVDVGLAVLLSTLVAAALGALLEGRP